MMPLAAMLLLASAPRTLPDVQQRLSEERSAAQKLAGREATLLGRLADLERQIELESRGLRAAQARLRDSTARLASSEALAKQAEEEVVRAAGVLGPRLFARYRLGREGYLRFLLGSKSIADVLRRKHLFNALLEADLDALAVLRFNVDGAKAARDELAAARTDLEQSVKAESERKVALQERVEQQRQLLVSVQREKALHEQAVRELEDAENALQAKLADIEARKPPPPAALTAPEIRLHTSIRKARGKLAFPLAKGRIEVHFGRTTDPRFGTITLQRGLDLRAPQGTPVGAVWDGKVVHAGWFKGYGNLIIVDHGDGVFSLMAHLDQLERAVGDAVRRGEQVGTVGDTGSLKGPYLYFELRDRQKPLDPERWLSRNRKAPALLAGAKGEAAK
jgi:septal ring factor EnvC (AmiA/AmiB activator)